METLLHEEFQPPILMEPSHCDEVSGLFTPLQKCITVEESRHSGTARSPTPGNPWEGGGSKDTSLLRRGHPNQMRLWRQEANNAPSHPAPKSAASPHHRTQAAGPCPARVPSGQAAGLSESQAAGLVADQSSGQQIIDTRKTPPRPRDRTSALNPQQVTSHLTSLTFSGFPTS